MGKGKTALEINYRRAIEASLESSYLRYGDFESEQDREEGRVFLESENRSQEDIAIRKNLFEQLSDEAQEVIMLIINPSDEQERKIRKPKQGSISKTLLKKYLRNEKNLSPRQIDCIWREIVEDFLKKL